MRRLATTGIFTLLAVAAFAQKAPAPTAKLVFDKASAAAGATVKATLTLKFAPGLHGYQNPPAQSYQIPVTVKVADKGFVLVKASYPKGSEFKMAGDDEVSRVYEDTIEIPLQIKVPTKAGSYSVSVKIDYQQCTSTSCYPPANVVAKAKLTVGAKKS